MSEVVIVSTGVANTASVAAAVRRCAATPIITDDAEVIRRAEAVILPGVGSFAAGLQRLRERAIDAAIRDRVREDRPLLAICLGMQMLCAASEESQGETGLLIMDVDVRRFPADVVTPQFGWNRIVAEPRSRYLDTGEAYFANTYRLTSVPDGWTAAMSVHGEPFVSAAERGAVLACQFHPELSGTWGSNVIRRWLTHTREVVPC